MLLIGINNIEVVCNGVIPTNKNKENFFSDPKEQKETSFGALFTVIECFGILFSLVSHKHINIKTFMICWKVILVMLNRMTC